VSRCGCARPSVGYFKVADPARPAVGFRVVLVCTTCHKNALGRGVTADPSKVADANLLPWLPSVMSWAL
jgi:hypothetical protein